MNELRHEAAAQAVVRHQDAIFADMDGLEQFGPPMDQAGKFRAQHIYGRMISKQLLIVEILERELGSCETEDREAREKIRAAAAPEDDEWDVGTVDFTPEAHAVRRTRKALEGSRQALAQFEREREVLRPEVGG